MKAIRGYILLLIAAFIWGSAFVAQSDGMKYVEPFTYGAIRTLIGSLVLIPVIAVFRLKNRNNTKETKCYSNKNTVIGGIVCGFVLFAASSLQQIGITDSTAGKAGFITALYVVIVPLIGIVIGNKIKPVMWLFIAMAIAGFWMLCIKDGFSVALGDWLILGCAVFFAIHIMVIDYFTEKQTNGIEMACVQFLVAGMLMLICMFIFEKPEINAILDAKISILYAGVMSSGVAYTFQILGQKNTKPVIATLIMSLESVFAALSGWLILGEVLSFKELAGCVLVIVAVVLAQLADIKREE